MEKGVIRDFSFRSIRKRVSAKISNEGKYFQSTSFSRSIRPFETHYWNNPLVLKAKFRWNIFVDLKIYFKPIFKKPTILSTI